MPFIHIVPMNIFGLFFHQLQEIGQTVDDELGFLNNVFLRHADFITKNSRE